MMIDRTNTSEFYNSHIYGPPDGFERTIPIGPNDTPTTALDWFCSLKVALSPESILEAGCGAGRNLNKAQKLWPQAKISGFDGSGNAVRTAQEALPNAMIVKGNLHEKWPTEVLEQPEFDLILDITASLQESLTPAALLASVNSMYNVLSTNGYAIVEGVAPDDENIAPLDVLESYSDDDFVTVWRFDGDSKPERVIGLTSAVEFYAQAGFQVLHTRTARIPTEETFGRTINRTMIQLILEK